MRGWIAGLAVVLGACGTDAADPIYPYRDDAPTSVTLFEDDETTRFGRPTLVPLPSSSSWACVNSAWPHLAGV